MTQGSAEMVKDQMYWEIVNTLWLHSITAYNDDSCITQRSAGRMHQYEKDMEQVEVSSLYQR
jgi:hypothetical protein